MHGMAIGRQERRTAREPRVRAVFGSDWSAVLDLLELTELAWHDCYGDVTPPPDVIQDILVCSEGDLPTLLRAARLAVQDQRDLRLWAMDVDNEKRT